MLDPKIRQQVIRSHALVVHGERMAQIQEAMLAALPMDPLEMAAEINKMSVAELAEYERLRNSLPNAEMFDSFTHSSARLQALSVGLHIDDRGQLAMARCFLLDACNSPRCRISSMRPATVLTKRSAGYVMRSSDPAHPNTAGAPGVTIPRFPTELPVIAGRLEGNLKALTRVSA